MTDVNEKIITETSTRNLKQWKSHHPRTQGPSPLGFPGGSEGKESACNAEDTGLIPGWERSPGKGNGYPLQLSSLENPMDRGTWQAIVCGVTRVGHDWMTNTFILIYSSHSLLALLAMCNFMHSLYRVLGFREIVVCFFLVFFLSFFHVLCFFIIVGKILSLLHESCFISSFLGCTFSSSMAHSSDLFWRPFLSV